MSLARSPGDGLRVAVAGAGWVSQHHLRGWARVPSATVVAICDPDRARAASRAADFGIEAVHASAATMLDTIRPDALDICAPPDVHAQLCALAAERGIPTLCQKPLASSLREAQAIAANAAGRMRLMVHENWRFRAPYRKVRGWLREHRIGELTAYRLRVASAGLLPDGDGNLPSLVRQPLLARLPRLAIGELLIHHLDVTRFLLGPMSVVSATIAHECAAVAGDTSARIVLETRSGVSAIVSSTYCDPSAPPVNVDALRIEGGDGTIAFDGTMLVLDSGQPETVVFDPAAVYADSYASAIAHFASGVLTDAPFETSVEDNLHTLELVEAAYRAAGTTR